MKNILDKFTKEELMLIELFLIRASIVNRAHTVQEVLKAVQEARINNQNKKECLNDKDSD